MIEIDVTGREASARGSPELVCENSGYQILFHFSDVYTSLTAIVKTITDEEPEEITLELSGYTATLPALPGCYGITVALSVTVSETEQYTTNAVWIPCKMSILDAGSVVDSGYFDLYNRLMEYMNGGLSGKYTQEELAAQLAEMDAYMQLPKTFPSKMYRRCIQSAVPYTRVDGSIRYANGTVLQLTNESIAADTLSISGNVMKDDYLLPGGVPSAEMRVTLRNIPEQDLKNAEITLVFYLWTESCRWYPVPLGTYTIFKVDDDTDSGTPITGYDDMRKLEFTPISAAGFRTKQQYSPNQIISMCCNAAGVTYAGNIDYSDEFVNVNTWSSVVAAVGVEDVGYQWYTVIENADGIEDIQAALAELSAFFVFRGNVEYPSELPDQPSLYDCYKVGYSGKTYVVKNISNAVSNCRDLLMHLLFTVGAFGYISRNRVFRVVPLSEPDEKRRFLRNNVLSKKVSKLEYRMYELETIIDYKDEDGINISYEWSDYTLWSSGVSISAASNPVLATIYEKPSRVDSAIRQSLITLIGRIDPVRFSPGRMQIYGDPSIEPYEWIRDGEKEIPITSITWNYRKSHTLESCGDDAVAGLSKSQQEKAFAEQKVSSSSSSQNIMHDIYGKLMHTYRGLDQFIYSYIEHYTYSEIERGA